MAANALSSGLVPVGLLGSMGASVLLPVGGNEVAAVPDGATLDVIDDGSVTAL